MAIETTEGGTMVTGEHVGLFRLLALKSALALEINTSMKASSRFNAMRLGKDWLISIGYDADLVNSQRSKKTILEVIVDTMEENGYTETNQCVLEAIGKEVA